MQSEIFNYIGLYGADPAWFFIGFAVVIIILLIVIIVQGIKIGKIRKKYEKFMKGKDAASLEDEIKSVFDDISFLKEAQSKDSEDIKVLYNKAKSCYQRVGLVKYDAFHEMGGQLSFALCMLDEENNGFIINSVHSNAGCYVYTKNLVNGISPIDLGDEEAEALNKALGQAIVEVQE